MRKLASIQKILNIEPIDGADRIEKATVLGWQVVVPKNTYKIDQTVIYCEIDSIIPDDILKTQGLWNETLDCGVLGKGGNVLKTRKFKGVYSQGLICPLSVFNLRMVNGESLMVDDDVTDMLGITKYEPTEPAVLSGMAKGSFPTDYFSKSDETRIQSAPQKFLDIIQNNICYVAEKLDGSSFSAYFNAETDTFGVCSRNLELKKDEANTFWKIAITRDLENKLRDFGESIMIQGELVGPGINGNKLKLPKHELYVFTIQCLNTSSYYSLRDMARLIERFGLTIVPILGIIDDSNEFDTLDKLLEFAGRKSELNSSEDAEGIVVRNTESFARNDKEDNSFKVISNKFLVRHGE